MAGILYVVGTPIGNLSDMTFRAIDTLKSVDFIASEDTRVSSKLLNYFEIKKPLISYHEHNHKTAGEYVLSRLIGGESCAIITDAGMPCISDPGEDLVKLCAENEIEIKVIPGPSACVSALAISGLDTAKFSFEGFLSVTKKSRFNHLSSVSKSPNTLIFHEAPHKLLSTLKDMYEYFGDRRISLCREMTKIHEEVFRTTLSEAISFYENNTPKGEFVLVVEGAKAIEEEKESTIEDAYKIASEFIKKGMKPTEACREAAKLTSFSKSEIYTYVLNVEK